MRLKRIKQGVQIKFDNDMEKKILELFLYHADLKSSDATVSLGLFDNFVLNDKQKDSVKRFVNTFTTSFMQLADAGYGCPNEIDLRTDVFELNNLLPDFLVGVSLKNGIEIADLNNPFNWLFKEIDSFEVMK